MSDFRALTFDCYGTLIDWESGMVAALEPLVAKARRPLTRNEVLQAHALSSCPTSTTRPSVIATPGSA